MALEEGGTPKCELWPQLGCPCVLLMRMQWETSAQGKQGSPSPHPSPAAPWSGLQGTLTPLGAVLVPAGVSSTREGVPGFGLLQLQRTAGAALEPLSQTQERVTQKELKYLEPSQLSTAEKSCPVVRYFKYNVFILYIFIHM